MVKLYADENFPQPAVEALRELGHDVLTTLDSGKAGQAIPDEDVLAFATEEDRILVTLNRKHFIRLHRDQPDHAGIIVCTFDADFNALAQHVHTALETNSDMTGELIRVNRSG
ncbi:MAG: DUF5615 family PIN-like protein [Chloroflexota bacterium]